MVDYYIESLVTFYLTRKNKKSKLKNKKEEYQNWKYFNFVTLPFEEKIELLT